MRSGLRIIILLRTSYVDGWIHGRAFGTFGTLVLFDEMTPTLKLQSLPCRVILPKRSWYAVRVVLVARSSSVRVRASPYKEKPLTRALSACFSRSLPSYEVPTHAISYSHTSFKSAGPHSHSVNSTPNTITIHSPVTSTVQKMTLDDKAPTFLRG